jgi:hypothetical protein
MSYKAIITISFYVPAGFAPCDYVKLHGNNGSGAIDWDTPLIDQPIELFPDGIGYYGFGLTPFGQTPFGEGDASRLPGFGQSPFGKTPFGLGSVKISATWQVYTCGSYKFGFASYDKAGNKHSGSPEEITVVVHLAPPAPTGLRRNSYNKDTNVLVLDAL